MTRAVLDALELAPLPAAVFPLAQAQEALGLPLAVRRRPRRPLVRHPPLQVQPQARHAPLLLGVAVKQLLAPLHLLLVQHHHALWGEGVGEGEGEGEGEG